MICGGVNQGVFTCVPVLGWIRFFFSCVRVRTDHNAAAWSEPVLARGLMYKHICVCPPDVKYSVVTMGILDLVVDLHALGAALPTHGSEVHAITPADRVASSTPAPATPSAEDESASRGIITIWVRAHRDHTHAVFCTLSDPQLLSTPLAPLIQSCIFCGFNTECEHHNCSSLFPLPLSLTVED